MCTYYQPIYLAFMLLFWFCGCSAKSQPTLLSGQGLASVVGTRADDELAPYISSNEPTWPNSGMTPTRVVTPLLPNTGDEDEDEAEGGEEEEQEDDPAIEACHDAADSCFASDGDELPCLTALVQCLSATEAKDMAACIQSEVDCLKAGMDSATCEVQADGCLGALD
ncbi:MAG: hypothetical protein VX223_10950 [Myxococcota bacterium]|nr:hypothetical protein [Myxococcota bacterium]